MDDIHARAPVDRVAVRVSGPGEHFEPRKCVLTNDSDLPLAARPAPANARDLTGLRFGRFVVIGFSSDHRGHWVVRCDCGRYSTRRARAIKNRANSDDRCEHCRHLAFLQRDAYWWRTGRDK